MKKIVIMIPVMLIFITIICFIVFKFKNNNDENIKDNNLTYETVSDDEENQFDSIDYHYYVTLLKYNPLLNVKKNATREEREKYYYYYNNIKEAMFELCKKNGEWEYILYADTWGEFNKRDELLGKFKFDTLKIVENTEDKDNSSYIYVEASDNRVKRIYHIYWDEIKNINVKLISEENLKTNEVTNFKIKYFTDENIESNFIELCKQGEKYPNEYEWNGTYYGDNIALSDNFKKKYPYFLDVFIHYSPLKYNNIKLIKVDKKDNTAIFEVESILECKRRTYYVEYLLNKNLMLDEVNSRLSNEIFVDLGKPEKQSAYWIYKNSNWDKLKTTEHFQSKFNNKTGIFGELEILNFDNASIVQNSEYIYKFILQNGETQYFYLKKIANKDKKIDDIIYEKLPYDSSMTIEEVKEAYLRDYANTKGSKE